LTALVVPLVAFAQSTKQVEVINLPAVQDVTGTVEVTNDAASPVPVEVTNQPAACQPLRWQLVGYTVATVVGNDGFLNHSKTCAAEFADSRICTSREVIETTNLPDTREAWVRPEMLSIGSPYLTEISGVHGDYRDFVCDGAGGWGLSIRADGKFQRVPCADPKSVACCALVP
jgi:hypothetical protein